MNKGTKFSVGDVRRIAQRRTSNLYDTYFTRIVSAWVTAALAPFEVSPNAVSLINFVVGLTGCLLIGFGSETPLIIGGVLLVHLYAVLDSVDGELARLLDRGSLRGMFLEDWSAYAMLAAFPLSIGVYLSVAGASPLALVLAVLFAAIGRNTMPAVRRAIAQSRVLPSVPARPRNSANSTSRVSGWKAIIENHLLHQTNIRLVLTSLVVVHIASGMIIPLEAAFYGYMAALFLREAGIFYLALQRDLVNQELHRLRGRRSAAPRQTCKTIPQGTK